MKLHLPSSLRKALLAVIAAVAVQPVTGAVYSGSIGQTLYTDFADNCGLFSTHNVNEMLRAVREKEGGVVIYYDNAKYENYVMPQEMISFESQVDGGYAAGVGYNFIATVAHNGVIDPTFSGTKVGSANAIRYSGIEYRSSTNNAFLLSPNWDYKITRLSKIVTDVTMSEPNTGSFGENWGRMLYRSGSGTMQAADENGNWTWMAGGYSFNLGGMMTVDSSYRYHNGTDVRGVYDDSGFFTVTVDNKWVASNDPNVQSPINPTDPMPFCGLGGDSGSPTWFWNSDTNSYVYAGAVVGGNLSTVTYVYYAPQWTVGTIHYFDSKVNLDSTHDITINAVSSTAFDSKTDGTNNVTGQLYQGTITDGSVTQLTTFIGVKSGVNTWNDLSAEKDKLNWYNYGGENAYLNATNDTANPANGKMTYADLFYTQNLVFSAKDTQDYRINLAATVDTGIGYAQFSKDAGVEGTAKFYVSTDHDGSQLNTAGFVVDAGVELHMRLTGESGYLREWRKTGAGALYIEGNGDNNVLLNLGGKGTTYLNREDGFAAYNVLASSGAKVVIKDTNQIKRDFTLGNGGATLDMNGQSMELWSADTARSKDNAFSIHALTQEGIIANGASQNVTLTWKETEWNANNTATFLGSFRDESGKGSLQFVYDAEGKTLILNSNYTELSNADSSITVRNGTLAIEGTNTVHAPGSAAIPFSSDRLRNAEDWHYSDMTAPVAVEGGTFELGSHARLKGDVTVSGSGTFLVRESVTHQEEYIEGSYKTYDTDLFQEYFGHKGTVALQGENAAMRIEFHDGADSTLHYGNAISGNGKLVVNSGNSGGLIEFSGDTTAMTGQMLVEGGGLVVTSRNALGGDSAKWEIGEAGWLKVDVEGMSTQDALKNVSQASAGVLLLNRIDGQEYTGLLNMSGYEDLIIGVGAGEAIHYGTAGDTMQTNAGGEWHLGGGGGELIVDARLHSEDSVLVLGNKYATGTVTLTNNNNRIDRIDFVGRLTLNYDNVDALGGAAVSLQYTNRMMGIAGVETHLSSDSSGVILMDGMDAETGLNLSGLAEVSLSANSETRYNGIIDMGANTTYHLGGGSGTLILGQALTNCVDGTARNLVVDGQTYSGGTIELERAATITGTVTVQGSDRSKVASQSDTGSVTLRLGAADALQTASGVTVKDGGIIDVNGLTQTMYNVSLESGSSVVDSSNSGTLAVVLSANTEWRGTVDVNKVDVSGSRTLTLYGKTKYNEMHIQSGSTVILGANDTLSAAGKTIIENGAILNANGMSTAGVVEVEGTLNARAATFSGLVNLRGGTLNIGPDGTLSGASTLYSYGGTISGLRATLASNSHFMAGTTVFDAAEFGSATPANVSGTIEIAQGATLKLAYGDTGLPWFMAYKRYSFTAAEVCGEGTLYFEANDVNLSGSNQTFGGTLRVSNKGVGITGSSGLKSINNLQLDGNTTTLKGNANWSIANIAGSGNLSVNTANKLSVTGESSWTGTLTKTGTGTLAVTGENALQAATVNLADSAKLEVGAARIALGTLNSSSADAVIRAGGGIRSGEAATLEIRKGGTFSGQVLERGDNHSFVSLLMNGEGTFTLDGSKLEFKNVTAQKGKLVFGGTAGNVRVTDSFNIACGSELEMQNGMELIDGQTLRVISSATASDEVAKLTGDLTLGGGKLSFSGADMNRNTASLLSVSGNIAYAEGTESLLVNFTDTGNISLENTYVLSSSNWSNISGNTISSDLGYLDTRFTSDAQGLRVQFTLRDDSRIWQGTDDDHRWNSTEFGTEPALGGDQRAVFTDAAEAKDVDVTGAVQAMSLVFDSAENYNLSTAGDGSVSAENLVQMGRGTTTLDGQVNISGTATVKNGNLVLEPGSSIAHIDMQEGTGLTINQAADGIGAISGKGAVEMKLATGKSFDLNKLEGSYSLSLGGDGQYGSADGAVHTGRLAIRDNATLSLNGAELNDGGGDVVLGGNLRLMLNGDATLGQNIEADTVAGGEARGTITKAGSGTLSVNSAVTAGRLTVESGNMTVSQGAALDVRELAVGNGTVTVQRDGSAAKSIGNLELGDNAVFVQNNAAELGQAMQLDSLKLTGANAAVELQGSTGGLNIRTLDAGAQDTTLTLANKTGSTKVVRFELGAADAEAGNFAGDIILTNTATTNRSTALILSNGEVAENARINLVSGTETGIRLAVGLNAETVNIAGLSSSANLENRAEVFSGNVGMNAENTTEVFEGDGAIRNMAITAKGDNTFYGAIGNNINISVSGTGTQAFMGSSIGFDGSLTVADTATLSLGTEATSMLGTASSLTVGEHATLQTGAAISIRNAAAINGTLAMGGTVTALSDLKLGNDVSIILGGGYTGNDNVRTYDVFIEGENGSVTGWEKLTSASFGGFGSLDRGAEITVKQRTDDGRYQVQVNMNNIQNTSITWSEDVAVGTWDSDSANFMEGGERTAYYAGDTVTIATDATISMGTAVNLQATGERTDAGTLTVQGGANAAVNQTAENSLTMEVLHVTDESRLVMNSLAGNYASTAIVDKGSTLESTIAATGASGTVGRLEGEGTFSIQNTAKLDLGNNIVSGGAVDASAFTGTVEIGNGSQQVRFRSSNITGLSGQATIEVDNQAQYWVTDNNGVVNANLVLHGNSGAAKGNSWSGEGFGAVRDASAFNGDITIDGNASVSGHNGRRNVVFNGKLQGYGESGQDTLTMACYYAANTMTYTFSSAADASGLDSFVLRRSGNDTNGNGSVANIEGDKGLAKSVEFYAGTADSAVLNIKADASAERLKSAAGDGVVNIGEGKSLELTKGADYGGQINLGAAVAASTADAAEGAVARVSGDVRFSMADATHASIAGAANGSTRVENMAIDLAAGTRLEMENITLSATSSITDAEATLVANSLVVEAQVGGNLKPLTYGDASPAPEARETGEVVSFTLSNIQDVTIEGTGLMVRLVGDSATALGGAEWLELGLGTDAVFTDSLAVTLLFTGADGQAMAVQGVYTLPTAEAVALAAEAAQPHDYVYFHLAGAAGVPEPASATLSLLALAALAARRRRKG